MKLDMASDTFTALGDFALTTDTLGYGQYYAQLECQVTSASFSRSALNLEMKGHSQLSSVVQAVLCLVFLMPSLGPLPQCVLASVVTASVHRLIRNGLDEMAFLWRVSRMELLEFGVAVLVPLLLGLEVGIFAGTAASMTVNLLRHSFASIVSLGRLKGGHGQGKHGKQEEDSSDVQYVELALFKQAECPRRVAVIEMKAELSFSNNTRLIERIRALLDAGSKLIVVSLNLTAFVDTTAIRQIVGLFEDARDAFICLSQCRPKVMELIHRYEQSVDVFPQNVRTFVSTHDAVRFLQHMCAAQEELQLDGDGDSDVGAEDDGGDDRSLSPLSAARMQIVVTPHMQSEETSLLHVARNKLRDLRSTPRSTTREAIGSDSEQEEAGHAATLFAFGGAADDEEQQVARVKWSEVEPVVLQEMEMARDAEAKL